MTQNYIFDLFKTLTDVEGFRPLFRGIFKIEYDEVRKLTTERDFGSVEKCVDYIVETYNLPLKKEERDNAVKTIKEWHNQPEIYPDVLETLTDLKEKKGATLGLISNCDNLICDVLDKTGLIRFFDSYILSHKAKVSKPNPAIYQMCLKEMGVSADTVTMVGDRIENDVVPPRELGMRAILIDYKNQHPNFPERITSLKELL